LKLLPGAGTTKEKYGIGKNKSCPIVDADIFLQLDLLFLLWMYPTVDV
jgi:hypothetical protein